MIFVFCECKTFRMTQESHNVSIKVTNHLEGIFQCHGVCRNIFIEEKMECFIICTTSLESETFEWGELERKWTIQNKKEKKTFLVQKCLSNFCCILASGVTSESNDRLFNSSKNTTLFYHLTSAMVHFSSVFILL